MDGFRRSGTQTSSKTSESSCDQSGESAQSKEPCLDSPVIESVSTEWTDEKHSLYLKSMEASFVNQLYSTDFLGWRSEKKNLLDGTSRQIQRTSSGQFKVLRGGCWQKINFERPEFQPNKAQESCSLSASPWIKHYKSAGKPQTLVTPSPHGVAGSESRAINFSRKKAVSYKAATRSGQFDACCSPLCQDLVGSSTEVSDQNFTDEEIKGEKASGMCSSKKMKTQIMDASSHDQIVPVPDGKPLMSESKTKCIFAAR